MKNHQKIVDALLAMQQAYDGQWECPGDKEYFYALTQSLPLSVAREMWLSSDCPGFPLGHFLQYRIHDRLEGDDGLRRPPLYAPIGEEIAKFADPKSGQRVNARRMLRMRFLEQDWTAQCDIISAMLATGTATDRQWAYKQLGSGVYHNLSAASALHPRSKTAKKTIETVRDICVEHLAEPAVALFAIRCMPEDFVLAFAAELANAAGYYAVCRRLCRNPHFTVEKPRLSVPAYYRIAVLAGLKPSEAEAADDLAALLRLGPGKLRVSPDDDNWDVSLMQCEPVRRAVYDMGRLGMGRLVLGFMAFDKEAQARSLTLLKTDTGDGRSHWERLLGCAIEMLDGTASDEAERMLDDNPQLSELADALGMTPAPAPAFDEFL